MVPQMRHSSYPRGMCLLTRARTVAIVFARTAGSESMYCAGVLTFGGGFIGGYFRRECITEEVTEQWVFRCGCEMTGSLASHPKFVLSGNFRVWHLDVSWRRERKATSGSSTPLHSGRNDSSCWLRRSNCGSLHCGRLMATAGRDDSRF